MNRYKLLLLYVVIASFLSIVGGYNFSFLNYLLTILVLFVSIFFSEKVDAFFKNKKVYLRFFIISMCCVNGILYFLTDSKDFVIVLFIQIFWFLLGTCSYMIKKVLKNQVEFFKEISQWYISFFIIILFERLINCINTLDVNFEIFHLLVGIFVWKIINIFLKNRQKDIQ